MIHEMTTEDLSRLLARGTRSPSLEAAAAEAGRLLTAYLADLELMSWEAPKYDRVRGAELMSCRAVAKVGTAVVSYSMVEFPSGDYFLTCTHTEPGAADNVLFQAMPGSPDLTRVLMGLHQHFLGSAIEISRFRNPNDERHTEEKYPHGWHPTRLFTPPGTVWKDPVRGYSLVLIGGHPEFELRDAEDKAIGQFGEPVEAEIYATAHSEALALLMQPAAEI